MGYYFQKSLKRATALALIFSVSAPVSASHVTWTSKSHINENDSFESIATGTMNLSIVPLGIPYEMANDDQYQDTETIRYLPAVEAAKEDVQAVKRSVVASDLLAYPQSYGNHKDAFQNLIEQVYRNTALSRCPGEKNSPYRNQIEEISDKLFKVSQKHLSRSKDRLEWINAEADLGSGGFFTFGLNNNQKNSIFVNDLNIALPLYGDHRQSNVNSLTPRGANLTADDLITAQFLNRIQLGEIPGNPFKPAIKYRRANKTMSLENLTRHMRGEDLLIVPYQPSKQFQTAQYLVANGLFLLNSDLKDRFRTGGDYLFARKNESLADYFVRCVYGFGYVSQIKRGEKPNIIFQDMGDYFTRTVGIKDKKEYAEYIVKNGMFLLNSDQKDRFAIGQPYLKARQLESLEDYFTRVLYGFGYMSQLKRGENPKVIFRDMSGYFTQVNSK